MIKTSGKDFQQTWLGKFPWLGVDQMICGGGYATSFFAPKQKQTFFSTQLKEQAKFFPLCSPVFLPVLWTNFLFSQFAEWTIFSSRLLNNLFSKRIIALPPIYHLVGTLVHDQRDNLVYCRACKAYPVLADHKSPLFLGTNHFRKDPLCCHQNADVWAAFSCYYYTFESPLVPLFWSSVLS